MPRVTEKHRTARREQILSAAARCFADKGFHITSMDDVITEAGLSAGAVYGYFSGKEDLIRAVTGRAMELVDEVLPQVTDAATPAAMIEQLLSFMRLVSERFGFDPTRVAVQAWGESYRSPEVRTLVHDGYERIRGHIAAAVPGWQRDGLIAASADPADVAKVLFGLIPGFIVQYQLLGDVEPASYAAALTALAR